VIIDREITIKMAPRDDGGLRIWSDDLPGLILSFSDQRTVIFGLGSAIVGLLEHKSGSTEA
jgi:hypothetical protein